MTEPSTARPAKVAVFLGTRPEVIKLAPVVAALRDVPGLEPVVVSTGQHREMLDHTARALELQIDHDLDTMRHGQTLAGLSARILEALDPWLVANRPDFALVQGDTTTVLMTALGCFYRGVGVGHVEAGLRTGDLMAPFPEEANRRLVSHLAQLHFAPTAGAREHLLREGIDPDIVDVTGNPVIDALLAQRELQAQPVRAAAVAASLPPAVRDIVAGTDPMVLITGHRRENFGSGMEEICAALGGLATRFADHQFVYAVHLNPKVQGPVHEQLGGRENVHLIPPAPYPTFVALMQRSRLVLTDSGGIQEEAPALGKPVLVMRDKTERPEAIEAGTAALTGADAQRIVSAATRLLTDEAAYAAMASAKNPFGDGQAGARIARRVADLLR